MGVRAFFAVEITDDVRHALSEAQRSLPLADADARSVACENLHVTMHFLGQIDDNRVVEACRLAEAAASEVQPFEIVIKGLTAVPPTGSRLRMIWATVDDISGRLRELHEKLGQLLAGSGFEVDTRPFRPHITMARFRSSRKADAVREGTELYSTVLFGRSYVRSVILFSSIPGKSGPTYVPLATVKLRGKT